MHGQMWVGAAARRSLAVVAALLVAGAGFAQPEGTSRPTRARPQDRPRQQAQLRTFMQRPPRIGESAPDFTLGDLEGEAVTLSDLYADRPVVLEFGCLTCPVYRGKIRQMQALRDRFGDACHFVLVYTVEAHPSGSPGPYSGQEWVGDRNRAEGLLIAQPADYEQRLALARRVATERGEGFLILVDGMDNAVWEAYGQRPNSAFLIDQGGTVLEKQFWVQPQQLERRLAQLVGEDSVAGGADAFAEASVSFEDGVWAIRDLRYGEIDGYPLLLDAYLPPDSEVHPALIHIHGGGWRNGDKAGGFRAVQGDRLLAAGIAVFSLNYRLSGVAPYPAAVDDCLAAIRWIRANAADLNIDPDRLAVWGGSAGGHLALMMGYLEPGPEDLDAQGRPLTNFVRCIVDKNGPTDLAADDMHSEPALVAFMGGSHEEFPERYAEASPITHLSADDPPVLIMHGTADRTVPYSQTVTLTRRLDELEIDYELFTFEGAGHGLRGADRAQVEQAMRRAVQFVSEHLQAD